MSGIIKRKGANNLMNFEDVRVAVISDFKSYKKWKARLRTIDNQINYDQYKIKGSQIQSDPIRGSGGPSDPTFQAVQELESLKREYAYIAFCMNRVDACLDAMTENQRLLMSKRYFENLLTKEVMKSLGIEKSEYYKRLDQIIQLCGEVCGYLTEKGENSDKMETK